MNPCCLYALALATTLNPCCSPSSIRGSALSRGEGFEACNDVTSCVTSRNQLSEDILSDVTDAAAGYGVKVLRADVKDLIFPGNLQEIMNRVLTAERLSQAQLVEARTKAEREAIEARSRAEVERMAAQSQAAVQSIRAEADADALRVQAKAAAAYAGNPALLRVRELEALSQLSANPAARIYIGFDKHLDPSQRTDD